MTQATERDYWISPNAFYIELNAMGLPDYIQASCVSGAKILVYIKDIISYDAGHNYKRWTLQASPTVFNTHTAKYVYAAVPRSDDGTKNAFIVFPSEELDVYGKNVAGQQIGSEEYYYVFLQGIITSSGDNGTENRDWQQRVSSGLLASDEAISATGTETEWYKYSSVDGIVTFLKNLTMKVGTLFRNLFVETLTIVSGGKIAFENQGEIEGIADNSTSVSSTNRIVTPKFLDDNTLSSVSDDTAQGLITFAKGLISEMLAQLKGGATFGKSGYKFDKDGNVVVDALSSLTFDEALERGFGITKNTQGKYTLSVTDLMVWGKAVFNSLEIRKLYSVGGNVNLSGASSRIQHVVPVRGVDGEVTGWKCYILGDDGTMATQNGWRKYDQAKCQTFDIKEGVYENVSNTYYWRLVTDVSTENEAITETYTDADGKEQTRDLYDGKKFGWVILSKTDCESTTNDAPKAGDTIVLDGHRMFAAGDSEGRDQYNDESRTNVMMLETTGVSDGSLPRIVALTGITDYRHSDGKNEYSNTVFILSPKEVVFVSSSVKWISASGDPVTFVNFRGNWAKDTEYAYYDQVSHNNAIWTCIVKKGDTTTDEPSDTSKDWRKEISGGKDGKDGSVYDIYLSASVLQGDSTGKLNSNDTVSVTAKVVKITGGTAVQVTDTNEAYFIISKRGVRGDIVYWPSGMFTVKTFDASGQGVKSWNFALYVGGTFLKTVTLPVVRNGKQGDGVVMAYKRADTQPDAPTGTDPEYPGNGWSLSPDAATAGEKVTDVRYGGYESGTYDGSSKGPDATAKEWAEAEDDGRTWMKSPSGLGVNYGYALMKVSFTTQYDNTTVDVEIKAYSEQNFDFVEVWALDTAPDTGTTFCGQGLAHASGNGVEQAYSFTVAKAGRHFICVTYAKDISGDDNGDYGLFRLDLSDNEAAVSDTVWMSQAKVSGGKCVSPWSTPVKINGADGIGAFEILCDPETIVIDTDDNGLATGLDNAYASLMCMRDGKEVSGVTYSLGRNATVNCTAGVSASGVVTITRVTTQSVTTQSVTTGNTTVTVSCTSGSVTVSVYDPTTKTTYAKTVPFTVNVAKYTGGLKADNKKLQSQYKLLTNNGTVTDLKEYKSEILQTAKEISLHVSEKSVGRRNMLVGSACRKYGDGFVYMSGSETQYYDNYPFEQIEINSGIDGVNCIHCRTKRTGTDDYFSTGFSWKGFSPQGNIKLEKGKNYVLSFYAKTPTPNDIVFVAEVLYQGSKIDTSRPARYEGPTGYSSTFSVSEANKWELFTVKVSVPSNAKYEYEEINIFARSKRDYFVDGYICKPMLEEGEEYNGWTLSEQDYDYVGGNLLDGTGTLTKTGNVETLDPDNVTQGGMGESASIKAVLSPTIKENDFLQFSTKDMGLKVGEDCMLSFYARAASGYAHGALQCYLYSPSTGIVMTESSHEKLDSSYNPADGSLHTNITPTTAWKRYWVHWRPMGNVPQHVLFRLTRPGTDQGSYDSSTSYNVGDVVLYDGTYYVCQKAGSGYEPGASSYWEATEFAIEIARPKLEVGATVTEWTAKRSDMVDKQALYATGIDIDSKKITLTASNTTFRGNDGKEMAVIDHDGLRATKIATTDNGGGHTEISGNTTVWYNKDGVTPGIKVFYDAAGVPHFQFCNSNGKVMYDFGPSGLQSFISSTQQAYSDECYLRSASSNVSTSGTKLSFNWLYVARNQSADKRFVWRKQIPTTEASSHYEIYDGCVFTKEYYNTANSVNWPKPAYLLPDGWYVEPNDGELPMKIRPADNEGVFDPTQTVYYQTFYKYEGGKVSRTVRAYMKRTTSSQLVSKFTYAWSYDEI